MGYDRIGGETHHHHQHNVGGEEKHHIDAGVIFRSLGYVPLKINQEITIEGDATGYGTSIIPLTLNNTGVTPGTYSKVTVDPAGRITLGSALEPLDVSVALGYIPVSKYKFGGVRALSEMAGTGLLATVFAESTVLDVDTITLTTGVPAAEDRSVEVFIITNGAMLDIGSVTIPSGQFTTSESIFYIANGTTYLGLNITPGDVLGWNVIGGGTYSGNEIMAVSLDVSQGAIISALSLDFSHQNNSCLYMFM